MKVKYQSFKKRELAVMEGQTIYGGLNQSNPTKKTGSKVLPSF